MENKELLQQFSLSYIEGNEDASRMPLDSYDSIQDCIDWCDENGKDYYLMHLTEWRGSEIVGQVNLQACIDNNERGTIIDYATL